MFNLCINIDIDQQGQSFEKKLQAKKLGWLAQDYNQKVYSFFFWKQPNELITQMQEMIKNCVHTNFNTDSIVQERNEVTSKALHIQRKRQGA